MVFKRYILSLFISLLTIFSAIQTVCGGNEPSQNLNSIKKIEKLKKAKERGYIEDELIVVFKPSFAAKLSTMSEAEALKEVSLLVKMQNIHFKKMKRIGHKCNFFWIKLDKTKETLHSAKQKLLRSPHVEAVEPNYLYELQGRVPNDYYIHDLWGLRKIEAERAWEFTTGSQEVVVAVIDSGIDYTHEDLAQNMWRNPWEIPNNSIDDDGNGYVDDVYGIAPGYSYFDEELRVSDPMDHDGHGTHVAGIIGAVGNNGKGVVGLNWNVKLLACNAGVPVIGSLPLSSILACYEYIADLKDRGVNIRVINASYGSINYSYIEQIAIEKLRNKGILLVSAAGNSGMNNDNNPSYPCNYNLDNIICVAATDRNDNLAWFSNYGQSVHVAAPGVDILSTYPFTYENFEQDVCSHEIFYDDFESGASNWFFEPPAGLTENYARSGRYSLTESVDGNYRDDVDDAIIVSRKINLSSSSYQKADVKIFGYFSVRPYLARNDYAILGYVVEEEQIFPAFFLDYFSTKRDHWNTFSFYVPKDLRKPDFQLFMYLWPYNDGITDDGVYWDDIGICVVTMQTDEYMSMTGTSMATPFVSGLSALIWAKEPHLNYQQVKERILNSVDVLPQLSGKVKTSGRINAYKALAGILNNCTQPFIDVPCGYWAIDYIRAIKERGITKGCNPPQNDRFCPDKHVTRAEMAAFIIRAIEGEPTNYNPNPYFADVSPSEWYFKYVQRLKELGITTGYATTPPTYGPNDGITREQMAAMIIRALVSQGTTEIPPEDYCASGRPFVDVDEDRRSCRFIKKLKELGITTGYSDGTYKPENPVTREEMAVFIYRAFLK